MLDCTKRISKQNLRGISRSAPKPAKVILLYNLEAAKRLCSITAWSKIVDPSEVMAFWWGWSKDSNSSNSDLLINRSRYIFSKILKAGNCWQRSSLYNVASIRLLCWPNKEKKVYLCTFIVVAFKFTWNWLVKKYVLDSGNQCIAQCGNFGNLLSHFLTKISWKQRFC